MNRLATSSIPLALMLAAAARLGAQDPYAPARELPTAFPHRIIVKVAPSSLSPADHARGVLEPLAGEFGISSVGSWLAPQLLRPAPLRPMPKQLASSTANALANLSRIMLVTYSGALSPEAAAAKARSLPGVEYAEPVYKRTLESMPNDPRINDQWYLQQVKAFQAWDDTRADATMTIAIIDTGVDPDHPDLQDATWINPGENGLDAKGRNRRNNGVDDDANGYTDDWRGYDFGGRDGYTPDNDPSPGYWHGTHVAGIAAATGNNGIGIAGIAYGAKVMAVKISDDARENPAITAGSDGILYAAKMGARIINCSWGGPGFSRAEQDLVNAVTGMGSFVVAAAGNNGRTTPSYPASYRNVLSVASVRSSDQRSTFSNFNPAVGIAAPGENIYSTVPTSFAPSGYMVSRGTSMASPLVAGAAALVLRKYPGLNPEQLGAVLRANADNIDAQNPDYRFQLGSGRLNVGRALANGPNAVAASILDYRVIEQESPGVIEPGETIELRVKVKNILQPVENLRLDLLSITGNVEVITPEESFGEMMSNEVRETRTGIFRMVVPSNVPLDYSMMLQVTLLDGEREIGQRMIELFVNPNYSTTAHNRITATFTGNGRLAFNDFPNSQQGRGFHIDSSNNLLAEGGLLVGVSADRLADVVHSGDPYLQSNGLQTIAPYRVSFSEQENAEVGQARFNDAHLTGLQQIGVDIGMKTLQFRGADAERQTIVLYTIRNMTSAPLSTLFCALYLDWDLGPGGAYDQVAADLTNRLGYTRNTRYARSSVAGAVLLSDQPMNFYALDNSGSYPLSNGFYQTEKWDVISGGVRREESSVGDCSMIIGAGPIDLAPGADTTIAFALVAGSNLTELQASAADARARFAAMGGTPGGAVILPRELAMSPHPNPFDRSTVIEFQVDREGSVALDVYNALGEHVSSLASGFYRRGTHQVVFTAPPGSADEVYMVRLTAGPQVITGKLVRLAR